MLHCISVIIALTTINVMRFPGGCVFPAVLCEITAQWPCICIDTAATATIFTTSTHLLWHKLTQWISSLICKNQAHVQKVQLWITTPNNHSPVHTYWPFLFFFFFFFFFFFVLFFDCNKIPWLCLLQNTFTCCKDQMEANQQKITIYFLLQSQELINAYL